MPRRAFATAALLTLPLSLCLAACSGAPGDRAESGPSGALGPSGASGSPGSPAFSGGGSPAGRPVPPDTRPQTVLPRELPALGPAFRARVPAGARQAVVVTGKGPDSSRSSVALYERHPAEGWKQVAGPWPAHNGLKGWTDHHLQGDLRSPIGVFGLTDAGGLLPDPGTKLPYDQGSGFTARGTGSQGEPLEGSFDYVVAINYNREPGTTPLDWTRPMGEERGGGIWFHVDHDGPTQGCVSLEEEEMRKLLRWLDPAKRPVVVMGDAGALGR